jgi:transposase-like protein
MFASQIRKKRVYVKINGEMHDLWPAVDHEGEGLESFVTKERDRRPCTSKKLIYQLLIEQ